MTAELCADELAERDACAWEVGVFHHDLRLTERGAAGVRRNLAACLNDSKVLTWIAGVAELAIPVSSVSHDRTLEATGVGLKKGPNRVEVCRRKVSDSKRRIDRRVGRGELQLELTQRQSDPAELGVKLGDVGEEKAQREPLVAQVLFTFQEQVSGQAATSILWVGCDASDASQRDHAAGQPDLLSEDLSAGYQPPSALDDRKIIPAKLRVALEIALEKRSLVKADLEQVKQLAALGFLDAANQHARSLEDRPTDR